MFISGHITQACYYRILIPELVDKEIEKIIYLDCDLIVLGNLIDLFNIDINNYFVGAVEEKLFDIKEALGMDENTPYFNSGVMLINLKEWRKNNISEKTLDFIRRSPEKIKLYDQDALNFILANKCLILNKKYNQIILGLKKTNIPDNTFIIHYTGTYKPWHFVYNGSYKKLYKKYLKLTPWNNYRYPDLNLNNILKKYYLTFCR